MTPIYFESLSNDQYNEHRHEHEFLSPKSQASLSSNSLTCHIFFNPNTTHDQDEAFDKDQSHPSQIEDDYVRSQACDDDQVKWTSSKMRLLLKMKKTDQTKLNTLHSTTKELRLEDRHDHKERKSSPMEETANSINSNSSNSTPIRVCSDCNTTKTPLWRSGPKGPKSLCNACGIRQRKARKAMAAAGAEVAKTGKNVFNEGPTSLKATKILHKDYKKPNKGHVTKCKNKLCSNQINAKASPSSLSPMRKNTVEEFLVSLSKNLALHCVSPQDEKEAAILLMALSCGYVHQ
ncbi:uncharacterized protein LOC143559416 [Bidens hawaiensis]|uniref:uncharacterized protein LOC143559416 n=1 Tax=Bidens hawaiensis TaxID=980011 RepID=UPI00404A0DA6